MDYELHSDYDERKQCWNVTVSGEIDIFNSAGLKKSLSDLLQEHDGHLFLHCQNLEYIDSTALGALVAVMKTVKSNGKEMHLVSVKPALKKLFRITNLDTIFIMDEGGAADD